MKQKIDDTSAIEAAFERPKEEVVKRTLREASFHNKGVELRLASGFVNEAQHKETTMNVQYVKWLGLLGALFAGSAQIIAGDIVNGTGIIAAALSSAGIFASQQ